MMAVLGLGEHREHNTNTREQTNTGTARDQPESNNRSDKTRTKKEKEAEKIRLLKEKAEKRRTERRERKTERAKLRCRVCVGMAIVTVLLIVVPAAVLVYNVARSAPHQQEQVEVAPEGSVQKRAAPAVAVPGEPWMKEQSAVRSPWGRTSPSPGEEDPATTSVEDVMKSLALVLMFLTIVIVAVVERTHQPTVRTSQLHSLTREC